MNRLFHRLCRYFYRRQIARIRADYAAARAAVEDASRRRDTRAIHSARRRIMAANHALMREEVR